MQVNVLCGVMHTAATAAEYWNHLTDEDIMYLLKEQAIVAADATAECGLQLHS